MSALVAVPCGQEHTPEPDVHTYRTRDGREPDLFKNADYPVKAVCRVCHEPIEARSFLFPFKHEENGE